MAQKKKDEIVPATDKPSYLAEVEYDPSELDMRKQDIEFPRVRMVQKNSDEVDRGVTPGSLVDHMTGDVLAGPGEEVSFVPILHFLSWIQWGESMGDGIVEASMDRDSTLAKQAERGVTRPNGRPLVTEYHNFVVVHPDKLDYPLLLSFSKTSHKHGRRLLNLARIRKAPLFAGKYKVSTLSKENEHGKYYELTVANDGWVSEETFTILKTLHDEYSPIMREQRFNVTEGLDPDGHTSSDDSDIDDSEFS